MIGIVLYVSRGKNANVCEGKPRACESEKKDLLCIHGVMLQKS